MLGTGRFRIGAVIAALVVLSGCTTTEPDPPTQAETEPEPRESPTPAGLAVAIVLPSPEELDPSLTDDWLESSDLERDLAPEIRTIQTYAPEDPSFVRDLVLVLANRGTEVICALGAEGTDAIVAAHALHPELGYCAAPVTDAASLPDGVDGVEVRGWELGYVVGVAARASADGGAVGLVLSERPSLTPGFREGLLVGVAGARIVEPPEDVPEPGVAVESVIEAGATVVVFDTGLEAPTAVEAIEDRARVLAPDVVLGQVDREPDSVVMSWRVRWDEILLGPALRRPAEAPALRRSVGFAEGAFDTEVPQTAPPGIDQTIRAVLDGLVSGEIGPMLPMPDAPQVDEPGSGPSPRGADEDAGEGPMDPAPGD